MFYKVKDVCVKLMSILTYVFWVPVLSYLIFIISNEFNEIRN